MAEQKNNKQAQNDDKLNRAVVLRNLREAAISVLYDEQTTILTSVMERFVFVPETKNFVVFTCKKNLEVMCSRNIQLVAEQSLSNFPNLYKAFYTIHGYANGLHIPLVTVMLANREYRTFRSMWSFLKGTCLGFGFVFRPHTIRVDVERNTHCGPAVKSAFPRCHVTVCRARLAAQWYRELRNEMPALREHYKANTEIGDWLCAFFGLPFLPADQVPIGFTDLIEVAPNGSSELMQFSDYILENFIGEQGGNPKLRPTTWAEQPSMNPRPVLGAKGYIARVHYQLSHCGRPADVRDVTRVLVELQKETYEQIKDYVTYNFPALCHQEAQILKFNYDTWLDYQNERITRLEYLWRIGKANI